MPPDKMRTKLFLRIIFCLVVVFSFQESAFSQLSAESDIKMIFYNTENLFDLENDPLTDDDEFLPTGLMRWNSARFGQKINSIYKVIAAAGDWEPPAVAGLCEIENRKVLEELVFNTYLSRYSYGIIHKDSDDPRGIDVAVLYRRDILKLLESRFLKPPEFIISGFMTRDILYAKFLAGSDTLHLLMNHWPSKRGGVLSGEEKRIMIAEFIRGLVDSINASVTGGAGIIIAGDFNSEPADNEIRILTGTRDGKDSCCHLINMTERFIQSGEGTYKYRGIWQMFDQAIVSSVLLDSGKGYYSGKDLISVFRPDFLLNKDPGYPGKSPFSTYKGYRYHGGYSDHLPVVLTLKYRGQIR